MDEGVVVVEGEAEAEVKVELGVEATEVHVELGR